MNKPPPPGASKETLLEFYKARSPKALPTRTPEEFCGGCGCICEALSNRSKRARFCASCQASMKYDGTGKRQMSAKYVNALGYSNRDAGSVVDDEDG